MSAADARVRCLWIFESSATAYSAHILAILDWVYKFYRVGGEYPVPKLPSWLTTYIHVTSIPRFPEGLPDLPRQQTAMRIAETAIRSPATWQWMADLLQYWSDVSNTKTPGGLFRTQSALVERLMDTVNPWFPAKDRITSDHVAFGTFHWLEARTMYRENRGGPLIFIKIPHLGQEYTLLKGIPYMAGNRASTQGHDVISTHYVIDTSGSTDPESFKTSISRL